jgi:hypothetical protein
VYPVSTGTGWAAQVLYTTTEIQKGYKVFPGDFNGDGKTDFLVRNTETDATGTWKTLYSTGKAFISKPFTFQYRPI